MVRMVRVPRGRDVAATAAVGTVLAPYGLWMLFWLPTKWITVRLWRLTVAMAVLLYLLTKWAVIGSYLLVKYPSRWTARGVKAASPRVTAGFHQWMETTRDSLRP